jgi:hypothetical protein
MARYIKKVLKKRIGFEALGESTLPRSVWKKIITRPHLALTVFASVLVLFVGLLGLVLPVIPGVAVIVLGIALFFYGINKFLE